MDILRDAHATLMEELTQRQEVVKSGGVHVPPALRLLLLALAHLSGGPVLETGYDAGFTTGALALSGLPVVGVDNLSEYGYVDGPARERLADYQNVTLVKEDALVYLRGLDDESLGLAFIDDNHDRTHVMLEAQELRRALKPGGFAVFHDTEACYLCEVLDAEFPGWELLYLPAVSPDNGLDYGVGIVRKPL
jgi:predicted O-methyltransferase YrrM